MRVKAALSAFYRAPIRADRTDPICSARSKGRSEPVMDDATDVNKVVAAIFAANMCSAKENKHENYLAEYEAFLSLLEARDARAREAAEHERADSFPQIGR